MRWKWTLLIGIFLIIAMLATVYVILRSYDYNKLKPQIARLVKENTGRALHGRAPDECPGFTRCGAWKTLPNHGKRCGCRPAC